MRAPNAQVAAEVVPVTLRLSADELNFSFGIDNWENFVDQVRASLQTACVQQRRRARATQHIRTRRRART
jgi:hypothetical protein